MSARQSEWIGDPALSWSIVAVAHLTSAPAVEVVADRLRDLSTRWEHLGGAPTVRTGLSTDLADLRVDLGSRAFDPHEPRVRVAVLPDALITAGHHGAVDGLGLLAVLAAATGDSFRSTIAGIGDRSPGHGLAVGGARRLSEALLRPPSRLASDRLEARPADAFACRSLPHAPGTADLAVATARAAGRWNRGRGRRMTRPVVAVGLSRRSGTVPSPVNDSAFMRLRDPARAGAGAVRRRLASAPPEPTGSGTRPSRAVAAVSRVLGGRMGSTLLVSSLGGVTAAGLRAVEFYPVTGGASALSVGSVTVAGTTTLTARARGRDFAEDTLSEFLAVLAEELARV